MAIVHRRRSGFAAGLIALAVAGAAQAQYRVDNSQANDASNRIGSGGFNGGSVNPYAPRNFANGNNIVTGNVTGGRAFRGSLGYTAASQFRGNVGSGDFDRFIGDSVGVAQLRDAPNGIYANRATISQPYFGAGQTVQPPAGFAQSPGYNGGYVPQGPRTVFSNDGRIDYGGATRSQVVNGILSQSTVIGGPGLDTTATGAAIDRERVDVSEYTSLARPRIAGDTGELFRAPRDAGLASPDLANKAPDAPDLANPTKPADGATDTQQPQQTTPLLGNDNNPATNDGNAAQPGDADSATKTGQGLSVRTRMNATDGTQYGQLRERMRQQQRSRLPNADAIERSRQYNEQVLKNRAEAAKADDAKSTDANKPDAKPDATPQGATPQGMPTPANDGLRLPRPAATPEAAPQQPAAPATPLEIQSLTTGVSDANLKKTLGDAEQLMKAGKFTSAIDAYDRAEAMTTADPLVFVGRGIAELGGGYYKNAEKHFREAFANDKSLMLARYDLNAFLSKDRLNFMLDDLGRVANASKNDPGPLLLLAFVYYNVNLPDRASRALDLADQRAGGKDSLAQLLRDNWTLKQAATDGTK